MRIGGTSGISAWAGALLSCVATAASALAEPAHFVMTDLGNLGGTWTGGRSINNAGVIVGTSGLAGTDGERGFRSNSVIHPLTDNLGIPAGMYHSSAQIINNNGHVAGMAIVKNGTGALPPWHGYLIQPRETFSTATDIGSLGGEFTIVNGMNDSGQIVGYSTDQFGTWHAYKYTPGAGIADLGAPNSQYSQANGINNRGEVVGILQYGTGGYRAFKTKPDQPISSDDLIGSLTGGSTLAAAINDVGQVTGYSDVGTGLHVYRTKPGADIDPLTDDLGTLPGSSFIEPSTINIRGDIVGWALMPDGPRALFAFGDSNTLYDLNTLIDNRGNWIFNSATGLNDLGVIVASASLNGTGDSHTFLLTPVPEPIAILLSAPVFCLYLRRRRSFSDL